MQARKYPGSKSTRRDYCQFILVTLINYTQTDMAEYHPTFSHDAINRYLREDDVTPAAVSRAVGDAIRRSENAGLVFDDALCQKGLWFRAVRVDFWYALIEVMTHTDQAGQVFCGPLKCNRKVDDSQGRNPDPAMADRDGFGDWMLRGKRVKPHGFSNDDQVKRFRVAATHRTEYVTTHDFSQDSSVAVKGLGAVLWKIEQYHCEDKQLLGMEKC